MKKLSLSQLNQSGGALLTLKDMCLMSAGFATGVIATRIYNKTSSKKPQGFFNAVVQEFNDTSDFINNEAIPQVKNGFKSAKEALFGAE